MKKAETLSHKRAKNVNKQTLVNFFEIYEIALEDSGILEADDASARIFNTDETKELILTRENYSSKKEHKMLIFKSLMKRREYTVLICGSADRASLGPLVVHKGNNLYDTWTKKWT